MASRFVIRGVAATAAALMAAGCAQKPRPEPIVKVSLTADRQCLARAMYFESHRGSDDGMLAVGTVVANRLKSGEYGATMCDVVGQKNQFAEGVLSRPMDDEGADRALRVADAVLAGKRHAAAGGAMFFHTAGLRFPYSNMHYVLVAGGNAFYEKRSAETVAAARENSRSLAMALAYAGADPTAAAKPIVVASLMTPAAAAQPARPREQTRLQPFVVAQVAPPAFALAQPVTAPAYASTAYLPTSALFDGR